MNDQEYSGLNLLIPDKPDVERDAVAAAWSRAGGAILKLGKFWRPPTLPPSSVRVYGPDTFGLVLADIYGLSLVEPPQEVALDLPQKFLRRRVKGGPLREALDWQYPSFVKPFVPKAFGARIYGSAEELSKETEGMDPDARVLASEIVSIQAEARAFVLDGLVLDCAVYEGTTEAAGAMRCAKEVAALPHFPAAFVLDLALVHDGEWVFLEANAAWGAGLNGCDAAKVLPAIERATRAT